MLEHAEARLVLEESSKRGVCLKELGYRLTCFEVLPT